ncbi:MAG: hypothetical protein LBH54_05065 [Clostridiales bacterium]|nr:hypothetical protein [Clostridiales bacterium]
MSKKKPFRAVMGGMFSNMPLLRSPETDTALAAIGGGIGQAAAIPGTGAEICGN